MRADEVVRALLRQAVVKRSTAGSSTALSTTDAVAAITGGEPIPENDKTTIWLHQVFVRLTNIVTATQVTVHLAQENGDTPITRKETTPIVLDQTVGNAGTAVFQVAVGGWPLSLEGNLSAVLSLDAGTADAQVFVAWSPGTTLP